MHASDDLSRLRDAKDWFVICLLMMANGYGCQITLGALETAVAKLCDTLEKLAYPRMGRTTHEHCMECYAEVDRLFKLISAEGHSV